MSFFKSTQPIQRLLITGASGLVGQHIFHYFQTKGLDITVFSHGHRPSSFPSSIPCFQWDPSAILSNTFSNRQALLNAFSEADAVINLSGAPIAKGRLTKRHKQAILHSRVNATRALMRLYEEAASRPLCWIQASATGYYGDTSDRAIDEMSPKGEGFLSDVCEAWEHGVHPLQTLHQDDTRVIIARLGMVLSKDAAAWKKLLLPLRLGLGSRLGSGEQWWSWIHALDVVQAFDFFLTESACSGVYNVTSPTPLTQFDFTKTIAAAIHRPVLMRTPAMLLRLALGGVADELILHSSKALPTRLQEAGFSFQFETLQDAVSDLCMPR